VAALQLNISDFFCNIPQLQLYCLTKICWTPHHSILILSTVMWPGMRKLTISHFSKRKITNISTFSSPRTTICSAT